MTPPDVGRPADRWVLFLAEGLGTGRIRRAPGTWGSLVGIAWFLLLLIPGHPAFYLLGTFGGIAASVWASDRAERILGRPDPGSVVIDEIAALPVCFLVSVLSLWNRTGLFPDCPGFLGAHPLWLVPAVFALFRLFDIWKPWPVGASQRLPGGWGIAIDDVLAAVWVNGVLLVFLA